MAFLLTPSTRRLGRWRSSKHCLLFGVIFTLIATVWIGCRYEKFEGLWGLWQQSDYEADQRVNTTAAERDAQKVNITILANAVRSGAVCLDGSPAAYYLDRGTSEGVNNWVLFLEGGGWCSSDAECLERSFTQLGSSRYMPRQLRMGGLLSSSPSVNPDFHNWNRVMIKYCDGGSFNGDVSEPKQVEINPYRLHSNKGKVANIFYRGQKIWMAVIQDLLDRGMKKAKKAFLSGCSAGGLASILHCDQYRDLMPKSTTVKCLSDAGFFLDVPDISGAQSIRAFFEKVVLLQNMVDNLPKSCAFQGDKTNCIFPQYLMEYLRTPFFVLNPAYDSWQFDNILVPRAADPKGTWDDCRRDLMSCSEMELKVVQGFRDDLLKGLQPLIEREQDGAFIDSCYTHCQSQSDYSWNGGKSPKVDDKSIATVVADWYFERNLSEVIDCPFPCNPTC